MRYSKNEQRTLPSPQVDWKPDYVVNLLMEKCHTAAPLFFKAFPRWKQQPGGSQNDGAIRGSIPRTCPGPFCAEDDFWYQSSLQGDRQPAEPHAEEPGAYLCLPGCVLWSLCWTVSCCFRPREHGGVCAGEMPLAGHRVVDAFGNDVRAFVLELRARSSGRMR